MKFSFNAIAFVGLLLLSACHDAKNQYAKPQPEPGSNGIGSHSSGAWLLGSEVPASDLPAPAKPSRLPPYSIPVASLLSDGLQAYAERFGWSIRWTIKDDYRLDAPLPIPATLGLQDGVLFVLRTYQDQGGLIGAVPVFHEANKVIVIEQSSAERK